MISRITWKSTHVQSLRWYLSRTISEFWRLRLLILSFVLKCVQGSQGDLFGGLLPSFSVGLLVSVVLHEQWSAIACWEVGLFGVNPSLTLVVHGESFEIFFWFDIALTRPCRRCLWWGIAISTPRNLFLNAVFDSVLSNALLWEFLVRF